MSSDESTDYPQWANHDTAVRLFEAYSRIVKGRPNIIKVGSMLNQSNVAAEAGYQRSTLSKKRFPELCKMIADFSSKDRPRKSATQRANDTKIANRVLREKLENQTAREGHWANMYINAKLEVIDLQRQLRRYQAEETKDSNIEDINSEGSNVVKYDQPTD